MPNIACKWVILASWIFKAVTSASSASVSKSASILASEQQHDKSAMGAPLIGVIIGGGVLFFLILVLVLRHFMRRPFKNKSASPPTSPKQSTVRRKQRASSAASKQTLSSRPISNATEKLLPVSTSGAGGTVGKNSNATKATIAVIKQNSVSYLHQSNNTVNAINNSQHLHQQQQQQSPTVPMPTNISRIDPPTLVAVNNSIGPLPIVIDPSRQSISRTTSSGPRGDTTKTLNTLLNTHHELSLPGFLELNDGFDFTYNETLRSGGGGMIYIGQATTFELIERAHNEPIIIKKLHPIEPEFEKQLMLIFEQEIAMMWFFHRSPYFSKILGYCTEPKCIIMKFYPLGTVANFIASRNGRISKSMILTLNLDVMSGLREMHNSGFAHCDIKPDNILIENRDNRIGAVLTDLGITQIFDKKRLLVSAFKKANIEGVSLLYAPPEVIKAYRADIPATVAPDMVKSRDVYSAALVYFEVLTRKQIRTRFPIEKRRDDTRRTKN
eukprot:Partr_v1_DN26101_c0_g1_i2_m10655